MAKTILNGWGTPCTAATETTGELQISNPQILRAGIFKLLWSPGIHFSLFGLADRYVNPIPTRFLAPIDCLKIPAQMLIIKIEIRYRRQWEGCQNYVEKL
jgi:hypothetical protein